MYQTSEWGLRLLWMDALTRWADIFKIGFGPHLGLL